MNSKDLELVVGAHNIARYGFGDSLTVRQVYRIAEEGGWPIFRLRGKLAARPAAIRAEIERRESSAIGEPDGQRRSPEGIPADAVA